MQSKTACWVIAGAGGVGVTGRHGRGCGLVIVVTAAAAAAAAAVVVVGTSNSAASSILTRICQLKQNSKTTLVTHPLP